MPGALGGSKDLRDKRGKAEKKKQSIYCLRAGGRDPLWCACHSKISRSRTRVRLKQWSCGSVFFSVIKPPDSLRKGSDMHVEEPILNFKKNSTLTSQTWVWNPWCRIHYGIFLRAHSTRIWHRPPQHSLPVSFDTVARELPPRMRLHRFASWKGDVPFIIQMLIALREARKSLGSQTRFFSSLPPPLKPTTV